MKKFTIILTVLIAMTITTNAQIPNSGFENWTTVGSYIEPQGYFTPNSYSTGSFYPVTRSTDHYPVSVGNYSIRLESKTSLLPYAVGVILQNKSNPMLNGPGPFFPITGHPTSLTGYFKYAPLNGDTMLIEIHLFNNGTRVSDGKFISTTATSNWTSFNIPLSSYIYADSGTILIASYYCNGPNIIPHGNSVLYIDNLNFDKLITPITIKEPTICLITIDTVVNRYRIVWEKFGGYKFASYNIYKEQGTSNYVLIDSVPFNDPAQFTDTNSRPENKQERYKISAVDSSGTETAKSPYHMPMFLQTSVGVPPNYVNLDWNFYADESGSFNPTWYYIYKGKTPGNLKLIDSVSGTINKYTELNASNPCFFRVAFNKDKPCDVITTRTQSNSGPYSQSVSNLKDYTIVGTDYLQVYPTNVIIAKEAQALNFLIFTSLSSWDAVSSAPSWLSIIKDVPGKSISANVTQNTTDSSRTANITVSASGQPDRIISITQNGVLTSIRQDMVTDGIIVYQDFSGSNLNIIIPNSRLNLNNLELFDMTGKRIISLNLKKYGLITIPVSGLKQGIYLVKVTGDKLITKKVYIY